VNYDRSLFFPNIPLTVSDSYILIANQIMVRIEAVGGNQAAIVKTAVDAAATSSTCLVSSTIISSLI